MVNLSSPKKKILIVPHHPMLTGIKIRLIEIARVLSIRHQVFLLNWHSAEERYGLKERTIASLKDLFKKTKIYDKDGLAIVEVPTLHRPLWLVGSFNSFFMDRLIKQYKFDVVINGSFYMFPLRNKNKKCKYIVDLADLPASGFKSSFDRFIHRQIRRETQKADFITVISRGLQKYISENYNKRSQVIPNGAHINRLRSLNKVKIDQIRRKYNLAGKWVIGYIGNIGGWVDVELAVRAFDKIKKEIPQALLIWIGPSPNIEELKRRYLRENVIFMGAIGPDVESYFQMIDIGILPSKKLLYQDVAFHMKLIEYTAARKIAVSTPINEVKQLNFPNIIQADLNVNAWAGAFKKARQMRWQSEWDKLVEPYSWNNVIHNLYNIIEGLK